MPKKKIRLNGLMRVYFQFRGIDLIRAREEADITEQELAERLPPDFWTQQNISRIESSNHLHTISVEDKKLIEKALNS